MVPSWDHSQTAPNAETLMAKILLEVCVDDPAGLAEAVAGGADRIELCSALALGGLTPSHGLMTLAAQTALPCYPIIRPRSGDFIYTDAEIKVMQADIHMARQLGLQGVVIGASLADGSLDEAALQKLIATAAGLDITLHRCIDLCPDKAQAIATARTLGLRRILTSGGALTASEGTTGLAEMIKAAANDMIIMPGSGVTLETLPRLAQLGLKEIHASCSSPLPSSPATLAFGFQSGAEKRTDRSKVTALKAALSALPEY